MDFLIYAESTNRYRNFVNLEHRRLIESFLEVSTNIMFLDIIHRPVYFSKHNVSDTGFCLRVQAKSSHLGTIDRAGPHLRTPVPAPGWGIRVKLCTNHLRELRKR
jgi:hypothetical protein